MTINKLDMLSKEHEIGKTLTPKFLCANWIYTKTVHQKHHILISKLSDICLLCHYISRIRTLQTCSPLPLLATMNNLFIDDTFEPGMCFLIDTLDKCIKNRHYGWISEKNKKFNIRFVFLGLKSENNKRKADEDLQTEPKRMRKLNTSLENLFLTDEMDNTNNEPLKEKLEGKANDSRGGKRMGSKNMDQLLGKRVKIEKSATRKHKQKK